MEDPTALVGTLLGAIIAGVVGYLTSRAANAHQTKLQITEARRKEYFSVLHLLSSMSESFRQMGIALSGRSEPTLTSSEDEVMEAHFLDQESAEAIHRMIDAQVELRHAYLRIRSIGSSEVADAMLSSIEIIDQYMLTQAENQNRRFIAKDFVDSQQAFDDGVRAYADAVREDLGLGKFEI